MDRTEGFNPALGFHALTPLYDRVVALSTREQTFKRALLDQAAIVPGHQVLDVGCGTGTLAIAAQRLQAGVRVWALDADPAILVVAGPKARHAGDSHNVRRFVTEEGYVQNEGDVFQVSPGGAYLNSYRSIIPARGQASNLAVPVCLSSSHIAYGSIRMEPVFMILGQSAATACVLAMKGNVDLQDVSYAELREQMLKDKQVQDLPPQASVKSLIAKEKLPGIVLDNSDAKLTGVWSHSSSTGKYVGIDYLHDGDAEKGTRQALFSASVKEAGTYSIRMSYSANPNRPQT